MGLNFVGSTREEGLEELGVREGITISFAVV